MIVFQIKNQNFGFNFLQTENSVYNHLSLENTEEISEFYSGNITVPSKKGGVLYFENIDFNNGFYLYNFSSRSGLELNYRFYDDKNEKFYPNDQLFYPLILGEKDFSCFRLAFSYLLPSSPCLSLVINPMRISERNALVILRNTSHDPITFSYSRGDKEESGKYLNIGD